MRCYVLRLLSFYLSVLVLFMTNVLSFSLFLSVPLQQNEPEYVLVTVGSGRQSVARCRVRFPFVRCRADDRGATGTAGFLLYVWRVLDRGPGFARLQRVRWLQPRAALPYLRGYLWSAVEA